MFWFGKTTHSNSDWLRDEAWELLPKRRALASTSIHSIINLLDSFSKESFEEALPTLISESGFTEEETRKTLALLPGLLSRASLEKRVKTEFGNELLLDSFVKLPHGQFKTKAVPVGTILHVTAGNVFLSSIDSLIMGFLTKNLSIIKVSSSNKFFPLFFAEKLAAFDKDKILCDKFAVVHWKGGDSSIETVVKKKVNAIIGWGGEEMISSYRKDLPPNVKFLDFGPKISLQIISKESLVGKSLPEVAQAIVADIIPWDQGACASPQNLYLQEGVDEESLLTEIDAAFRTAPARGAIDEDEATEILKETYRGYWSELMEGGKVIEGKENLLHVEKNRLLKPSPLHRSLIIKRFRDEQELFELLEPFSYYLQSCSYLLTAEEKAEYLSILSLTGIKRFAPLGTITWGMEGAPHDGRFVLRELVHFIGDEQRARSYGEHYGELKTSAALKKHFESNPHPRGYIFSSGGTTGEPKFVNFSYEEFDYMSDMLAENLKAQGIRSGMTVANLFVAGNLWSSFLCVDKALEKIGAIQLPIGGMCSTENIIFYLKKFKPDVVMGIPSMLVLNAEMALKNNIELNIPMIFYAGEALSEIRREFLEKHWKTKHFGSAGYASVDAGVIGYQCSHCGPGEHHLFSDLIQLDIIEDEGVVTSLARNSMPISNYRTGDRMQWLDDCSCGRADKRFKLLGRIDNVIHIWSCRMLMSDIETSLSESGILTFQIEISERAEENAVVEKFKIKYEHHEAVNHEHLIADLYERSRDLKDTIDLMTFRKNIDLVLVESIPRNPRTGKISLLIDSRK